MKSQFLSTFVILALAVSTVVAKKNITADFKDANFLAQIRQEVGMATGPIYDTYVMRIEKLEMIRKNIKSLDGIEHLKNLKQLDVRVNKITSIDLSKNPKLRVLFCSKNQITSLNLSNNPKLDWLECSDNQLTELDLSNNPLMAKLWIHNNKLTKLNLYNNPKLHELWCFKNNLSELDISNNTILKEFKCSHNQLTSLDLSKNIKLGHLDCSYNQLTELDMSNNPELYGYNCSNNNLLSVKKAKRVYKKEPEHVPIEVKITAINNKASRSKQEIMAVVNSRLPTLGSIYKRHLRMESYFRGNITLELTISPSGNVTSANIESDIAGYKEFNVEIRDMVATWKWKAIDGGNTTATIYFYFNDNL